MPDDDEPIADAGPVRPTELIAETERWFLHRGVPHFIDDYRASGDVLTRALPALLLVFLLGLFGAANLEWTWWQNLAALAVGAFVAAGVWAAINRTRGRRWSQLPDAVGPAEVAVFLIVPTALPLIFGGQVGSAALTFVVNLLLLSSIYLITSYGLVPMTRWALGQTKRQLGAVVGLFGRALPLLLLFTVALFINTEVWQVAASLDGILFWTTIVFFVLVGTAFLLLRLPAELGQLNDQLTEDAMVDVCGSSPLASEAVRIAAATDVEPVPLSKRQQGNILLVLFFSQAVQVLLVSAAIAAFFFVFGLVAIRPEVMDVWLGDIGSDVLATWEVFGREVQLTRALIHVSGFLGALSGFYFTVYVITDATYRDEFFTEIIGEVRQSLAVRNVYLALLAERASG